MADIIVTEKLIERFLGKCRECHATGCIEWMSSRNESGYGVLNVKGIPIRAHRIAWTIRVGPIPRGTFVLHRCDNPGCVNVEHLFLGTAADNTADMMAKGRGVFVRGEKCGTSKLTDDAVREIRKLHAAGVSHKNIAPLFGIHPSQICRICSRELWGHVK